MRLIAFSFIFFLLSAVAFADVGGQINFTQNTSKTTTGIFGYTVKYCDTDTSCFGYKCFLDYDSEVDDSDTSQPAGICNLTAVTSCFHDAKWYVSGTNICNSNVTYRACLTNETGKWSGLVTCTSGETCSASADNPGNCTASGSSSSTSGGGSGSTTTNVTFKHSIKLVSGITDIDIVQGESIVKYATFKNDGNLTLSNVTLVLSGLDENWYGINPPKFTSVSSNKTDQFNVTFFIPKDAQVKSYTINAEIKTHKSDVNAQFSFVIKVSPSNETVEVNLLPKYSQLISNLQALEQNITSLISQGADEGNSTILKNLVETIKSKLNQANQSIENREYFSANNLLSEAETLLSELRSLVAETKVTEKQLDIIFISIIAFVIIVVLFVLYLLWPQKARTERL